MNMISLRKGSTFMDTTTTQSAKKRVLLTGGTGFIGKKLVNVLISLNHDVTILTRNMTAASKLFSNLLDHNQLDNQIRLIADLSEISDDQAFDVIINLAGEPLAKGRWNNKRKEKFVHSRLSITADICHLIQRLEHKPEVFISGSAIGFYGPHQDEFLDEAGSVIDCFSHQLCKRWEEQALLAETPATRVCLLRIGIVLGNDGGSLAELRLPFDYGVSMQIADGQQWMSWIHRDDLIAIILHAMNQPDIRGPINATAPHPVTNQVLTDTLSTYLKTYVRIKVPGKLLSLMVGELADELLITGQRVVPAKLQTDGFVFTYPDLNAALQELIGSPLK
jgi:uncharacterized protein